MNHKEIVMKLIGEVTPTGESHKDIHRLNNLKSLCSLVNELVMEIDRVHYEYKDNNEHSIKLMADYSNNFLTNTLGISE